MEFVDDISTFADLGEHLRSQGCYVANLTSLDFSAKNGVGGCLKTLLRQFLLVGIDVRMYSTICLSLCKWNARFYEIEIVSRPDMFSGLLVYSQQAPDMSILASWYTEQENNEKPLVVIIDDVERCCGSVLNDFIVMLRYIGYFCFLYN